MNETVTKFEIAGAYARGRRGVGPNFLAAFNVLVAACKMLEARVAELEGNNQPVQLDNAIEQPIQALLPVDLQAIKDVVAQALADERHNTLRREAGFGGG